MENKVEIKYLNPERAFDIYYEHRNNLHNLINTDKGKHLYIDKYLKDLPKQRLPKAIEEER